MAKRILIVDDDPSFREVVKFQLAEEGYRVDAAEDGEQGLRLLEFDSLGNQVSTVLIPQCSNIEFETDTAPMWTQRLTISFSKSGKVTLPVVLLLR